MNSSQYLDKWYSQTFNSLPAKTKMERSHFDIFKLDPFLADNPPPLPYSKRDFYKIMLFRGKSKVLFADKTVRVKKQALSFASPLIPCAWMDQEDVKGGLFCIFDKDFFHGFTDLSDYPVFKPGGNHVYELADEQVKKTGAFYKRIFEELDSDYQHKDDMLRTIVFELMHFAMKMEPSSGVQDQEISASQRIARMFQDLLDRQFPIDDAHKNIDLRSASDFASQLNVHVNHLNRALKQTTNQTTSQLIADRILKESKILLKHSDWNVSEIGYSLGFSEATHFSNFFKKHVDISPSAFRSV